MGQTLVGHGEVCCYPLLWTVTGGEGEGRKLMEGQEIMDLVTSPIDQSIIVSTGADTSIRFWSIGPKHVKQPCAIICSGEGHRETILTIVTLPDDAWGGIWGGLLTCLLGIFRHFMHPAATCSLAVWITV